MTEHLTYPVALERDIKPLSLVRSRLEGVDLVIWRASSEAIHVWEDRCPHRSVRLSAGRNLGNCVEGVYHGWRFNEKGSVTAVPADGGKARSDIRVRVLSSEVKNGIVWATTGKKTRVPADFHGSLCRPVHVAAPAERVRASFADHPDLHLIATPWASDECFIFGVCQNASPDIRQTSERLSALGRRMEACPL